jgi:hypothetical protein
MSTTEITGQKPHQVTPPNIDELQHSLGEHLDALELHFGHGLWLPMPVDSDMRSIAETLASMMTPDDIRWMILQITLSDDGAPAWFIERRRYVLEKTFAGLVGEK